MPSPTARLTERLTKFVKEVAPRLIGLLAKKHYTDNFEQEGFDGQKWKKPKRRDPSSPWYGFELLPEYFELAKSRLEKSEEMGSLKETV